MRINEEQIAIIRKEVYGSFQQGSDDIFPGNEVLVLPKVDVKSRQIWKGMMQILYQIAISAPSGIWIVVITGTIRERDR